MTRTNQPIPKIYYRNIVNMDKLVLLDKDIQLYYRCKPFAKVKELLKYFNDNKYNTDMIESYLSTLKLQVVMKDEN